MPVAGRSRNAPCFCGSGRKLKHCCGRQLTLVRTSKLNEGCHWRFWRPHRSDSRYASDIAEHACTGERVWIARGTHYGTSWQIDDEPVTLLEIIDHLPGVLYHWVAEQTMTALNQAAPPAGESPLATSTDHDLEDPPGFAAIRGLMLEVLRLAHASDALNAHVINDLRSIQPADLRPHEHSRQSLAS
ncbi:MAG: SEC-C domain-containing protein [Steroidobacteraceae bacterium]